MAITLKEIAEAAGVSRGTVDRVLHGRGHVAPAVEEKVSILLNEMRYQPNRLGRGLIMSSRDIKLGMISQFSETPFMKQVLDGANRAKNDLNSMSAALYIKNIDSHDVDSVLKAIDDLMDEGIHGLALNPGSSQLVHDKMRQVIAAGIPIATFNTDAPNTGRLAYVGMNNYEGGRVAAGLMALMLRDGGSVLPIRGYRETKAHAERIKGFLDTAQSEFHNLQLLKTGHCFDSSEFAEKLVDKAIQEHPDLAGIFLSGYGQIGVCRALRRLQKISKILVICFDLTKANVLELQKGGLDIILDQNAGEQGYRPAMLLYNKVALREEPPSEYMYTGIAIKTRFNL